MKLQCDHLLTHFLSKLLDSFAIIVIICMWLARQTKWRWVAHHYTAFTDNAPSIKIKYTINEYLIFLVLENIIIFRFASTWKKF